MPTPAKSRKIITDCPKCHYTYELDLAKHPQTKPQPRRPPLLTPTYVLRTRHYFLRGHDTYKLVPDQGFYRGKDLIPSLTTYFDLTSKVAHPYSRYYISQTLHRLLPNLGIQIAAVTSHGNVYEFRSTALKTPAFLSKLPILQPSNPATPPITPDELTQLSQELDIAFPPLPPDSSILSTYPYPVLSLHSQRYDTFLHINHEPPITPDPINLKDSNREWNSVPTKPAPTTTPPPALQTQPTSTLSREDVYGPPMGTVDF